MDAGTERIYGLRELTRILNLTPKRLGQLRRLDLMKDNARTVRDLARRFHDEVRARVPEVEPLPEPVPAGPPTLF